MDLKLSLLLTCFVAGCFAFPKPPVTEFNPKDFYLYLDTKLVGATPAPEGSAPYMVALTTGTWVRSFFCGGSIISERHVLSAAHCIDAVYSSGWGLTASLQGTVGTNVWNSGGQSYDFSHNISHPNYVSSTIKNDIGILVTTSPIEFTLRANLVPLDYSYVSGGVVSRVSGWGRIGQNMAISASLLELYVSTITGQECSDRVAQYSFENNIINVPAIEDHIEVCTFHSNGRGNCNGDSGSPLVGVRSKSQFGIVSWGFPCARGVPDMFVRVSGFTDWLQAALAEPADRIIN